MNNLHRMLIQTAIIFIFFFIIHEIYSKIMSQDIQLLILGVQRTPMNKNYVGTLFVNLLLILTIYMFIVIPEATLSTAFILGIIIQGTINANNFTVFDNWSPKMSIIDTVAGGITAFLAVYLGRKTMRFID